MIETSKNETADIATRPRSYRITNEDIKNLGSFYCGQHEKKIEKYNEEINTLKQQLSELNEKMGKCYMPKHVEPGKLIETTFFYYFLKEMREMQDQISVDTKKKRKALRNISHQCVKYINSKNKIKQKKLEEEEKRLKTLSKHVSVYIDLFWKRIETLVWEEKKRELQQTLNKKKEMRFKKFVKGAIKKIKKAKSNATELFCNAQHQGSSNESTDDCNDSVQTESNEDKVLREDDLTDQEEEDYLLDKQMQSDEEEKEEQKKEVSLLDDEANIPLEELLKNIYGFESGKAYIDLMQQQETLDNGTGNSDDEEDSGENRDENGDGDGDGNNNDDKDDNKDEDEEENENEIENNNDNKEDEKDDVAAKEIGMQGKKVEKRDTELINEEELTTKATKDEIDITNMNCVISEEEEEEEGEGEGEGEGDEEEDMKEEYDESYDNSGENEGLTKTYSLRKGHRRKRGMIFETESMLKCKMRKQKTTSEHEKENMEIMSNVEFDEEEQTYEIKKRIKKNDTEDKHRSDDADDTDDDTDDDDDDDNNDDDDDDDDDNNDIDDDDNNDGDDDDDNDDDDDDEEEEEQENNENEEENALLCNMDEKHLTHIPPLIKAKLRDYQHAGLHWLLHLYKNNINGILADEMGLGKTLQCISLLAYLAYYMDIWGPHLVVVPASILINWEIELKRFCPCFKILCYYGNQSERHRKRVESFNKENAFHVCISTYSTLVKDHIIFKRKNWKYIILDEAHNIKNFNTKRWNIILSLKKENCILITGTPLQNSLEELWSLLHFLMPNIFTSHLDFKEWFSDPLNLAVQKNKIHDSRELIMKLHTVIRPYILRRLKKKCRKRNA